MSLRELRSVDAEYGVLGALMLKPELCEEVGAMLSSTHFGDDDCALAYNLILSVHAKGLVPDSITLSEHCDRLPSGEKTIVWATELMRGAISAANGVEFARVVVERYTARRLFAAGSAICELAQTKGDISVQLAQAQQALFDLSVLDDSPDVVSYRDILASVVDEIDRLHTGEQDIGINFGLPDLDRLLRGLRPGNLVVIAGKPGTGKTVLGTNLADKIATKDGKSALIFSLEMPGAELVKRALSAAGSVSKSWIDEGGRSSDRYWPALTTAVSQLESADVRLCDKGALTFSRLCNIARFQHRARKLHLIVVDYLTLIRADKDQRFGTRSQEVGFFSRGLKALAKELGIPIVVLAQLNRAMDSRGGPDAKPRMSDLRDSGEIEQDADIVLLGHRGDDDAGRDGITTWYMPKNRHGSQGHCALQFQGDYQRFVSVADPDRYTSVRNIATAARQFTPGFD